MFKLHRVIPTKKKTSESSNSNNTGLLLLNGTKAQHVTGNLNDDFIPFKKRKIQSSDSKTSSLLLLHGTKAPNVNAILKVGFTASRKGKYGPGVYHTNSYAYASNYSKNYKFLNNSINKMTYLFVNKVQQAEPPKSPRKVIGNEAYEEYKKKDPVLQIFN